MDDEASPQTSVLVTRGRAAAEPSGGSVRRRFRQYGLLALSFVLGAWLSDVIVAVADQVGLGGQDIFSGKSSEPPVSLQSQTIEADYAGSWGPGSRETFTIEQPSSVPVFNSITNNPAHGNELNFVQCKRDDESSESYRDEMIIRRATTLTVYAYIANASTHPDSAITGAYMWLLTAHSPAYITGVGVALSGSNTFTVWDGCRLYGDEPLTVTYVPESAVLHRSEEETIPLDDAVVHADALLPDVGHGRGVVPTDENDYGYLTLEVVVTPGTDT